MKKRVVIFLILLFFVAFSSAKHKIYLFPIVSTDFNSYLGESYNNALYLKLLLTDVFEVYSIKDFDTALESEFNVFNKLKTAIDKECKDKKYKYVVFGYLNGYQVRIYLYSVSDKKVLTEYRGMLYGNRGVDDSAKQCAYEIAEYFQRRGASRAILLSSFVPGLGHFLTKRYVRGTIYASGILYCIGRFIETGPKKRVIDPSRFKDFYYMGETQYTVQGNKVTQEQWYEKLKENEKNIAYILWV